MAKDYHPKNKPPFFQKVKQKEEEKEVPYLYCHNTSIYLLNR